MQVLFVDDERNILDAFSFMLHEEGYSVRTASCADDALRMIKEQSFDIVFLDQFLGAARGTDLMRRMAGLRPDLSYVIITGNVSTDLAVTALKNGASDFITKPFFLSDLVKSIEYVRKKRELEQQKRDWLKTLEQAVNEKTAELKQIYTHVLSTLAQAMEKRDIGTYGHSRRVSYNACLIAAALELDQTERYEVKTAALLHDIGKIGITDFVLGKKGPLTDEEWTVIRSHPERGVEILKPLKQFDHILPGILHHHENYDGSGYPHGISGERIPLHSRIIAVADAYDAILSDRSYRSASDHEHAIAQLQMYSGRQFDPRIVKIFIETEAKLQLLSACQSG